MSTDDANLSECCYRYSRTRIVAQSVLLTSFSAWAIWSMTYVRHWLLLAVMIAILALVAALVIKNLLHLGDTYTITSTGIRRDSLFGTVEQLWAAVIEIKRCRTLLELQCLKIIAASGPSMTVGGDELVGFDGFCEQVVQRALTARGESNWINVD